MTRKLNKVKESVRQARDFAAGMLIGSVAVTPVFAATTDLAFDDLRTPILVGSLALLLVGLLLKAMRGKKSGPAPEPVESKEFSDGIGQYRLQLGRGAAA
jgi:hypothetical protein